MLLKRLVFIALAATTTAAFAQSPANQQPTPEAYAQRNQQIEQAAVQVTDLVDKNQTAQVWDGASAIAKKIVNRDVFVKTIGSDRTKVGSVVTRTLASLTFNQSDGKQLPPGVFANVAFATRFKNEKQPVRELVSFHLDDDHVWRVVGYTLR
jgi:hypothetical protein